jgi:hypothetical protein
MTFPETKRNEELYRRFGDLSEPKTIISLVRDPIERNLSAYYFNHRHHMNTSSLFLTNYNHRVPLDFMFGEFGDFWGMHDWSWIDPEKGMNVWGEHTEIIIARTSAMSTLSKYLKEKYNKDAIKVVGKTLDTDYLEFKKNTKIPDWYLRSMIESRYAYTFFSWEHRREWKEKWQGG